MGALIGAREQGETSATFPPHSRLPNAAVRGARVQGGAREGERGEETKVIDKAKTKSRE